MGGIDGVLLDMDGVLAQSWRPLPGAVDALETLRSRRTPFLVVSNTTTHSRSAFARTLTESGLPLEPGEIMTAVAGTASYLRRRHSNDRVFVLSDGDPRGDLGGIDVVDAPPADVVVLGGASDEFSYSALNDVFRMVIDGAALVAMHRNLYWRTDEGLQLDAGAFLAGLELAAGTTAVVCGKPSPDFFAEAVAALGTSSERTAMVGDDVVNDVLGAQAAGLVGVLVRTGKFRPADLDRHEGAPDVVIDSIADLLSVLDAA
jgi:HAD superfamily hydrolase (TIGR01458 family)